LGSFAVSLPLIEQSAALAAYCLRALGHCPGSIRQTAARFRRIGCSRVGFATFFLVLIARLSGSRFDNLSHAGHTASTAADLSLLLADIGCIRGSIVLGFYFLAEILLLLSNDLSIAFSGLLHRCLTDNRILRFAAHVVVRSPQALQVKFGILQAFESDDGGIYFVDGLLMAS